MALETATTAIVRKHPQPSEHPLRADVNRTGNMPSVEAQFFDYSTEVPSPLPRFDRRPITLIELPPAPVLAPCSITLWLWPQRFCLREESRGTVDVAIERSKRFDVAFSGQLSTVSRRPHEEGPIRTYIDNLRELTTGREVEVVLFHIVNHQATADRMGSPAARYPELLLWSCLYCTATLLRRPASVAGGSPGRASTLFRESSTGSHGPSGTLIALAAPLNGGAADAPF